MSFSFPGPRADLKQKIKKQVANTHSLFLLFIIFILLVGAKLFVKHFERHLSVDTCDCPDIHSPLPPNYYVTFCMLYLFNKIKKCAI